jgi:hypothetical protein
MPTIRGLAFLLRTRGRRYFFLIFWLEKRGDGCCFFVVVTVTKIPTSRASLFLGGNHNHTHIKSVEFIQVTPLGYFIHISIVTPIASALKNYCIESFLEFSTDILNHFWIQVVVPLLKPPKPPPIPKQGARPPFSTFGFRRPEQKGWTGLEPKTQKLLPNFKNI